MGRGGRLGDVSSLRSARPVAREHLPRTVASVGAARLLVGDVLEAHGVTDRSVLDTAVLLASELATDGVRHGSGPEVLVEIALASGLVQLTVTVASPLRPAPASPGMAEHSQQVLDILASAWEVRTHDGVRTGWCRVDRPTTGMMPVVGGGQGHSIDLDEEFDPDLDPDDDPPGGGHRPGLHPAGGRTRPDASGPDTSRPTLRRVK